MGARPYRFVDDHDPAPGVVVEVGSERGEGSTRHLAEYAQRHGLRFVTADIDPDVHETARQLVGTSARLLSGVDMLRGLRAKISVAYLDGFDWIPRGEESTDWIATERKRYKQLGLELTNDACQQEHLAEARLVIRKTADRCLVIMDDTWLDGETWTGKGGLAMPEFLSAGFQLVHHERPDLPHGSLGYAILRK